MSGTEFCRGTNQNHLTDPEVTVSTWKDGQGDGDAERFKQRGEPAAICGREEVVQFAVHQPDGVVVFP
jgi:hypothetical protein